MPEQTPMTEERLKACEYILGEITSPYRGYINHDEDRESARQAQEEVFVEIRRLREENERLRKDDELGWAILEELSKQISAVHEDNERLKEDYKKILEYPLTGAEYADIAEAMRYRQIARTALQEVEKLEKGQTANNQAGDE